MKRTLRALPSLGILALTLSACEGHLNPKAPDAQTQTTSAGTTAENTAMTGPSTNTGGTDTPTNTAPKSSDTSASPSTSAPSTGSVSSSASSSTASSTPTQSSGETQDSSGTGTGPVVVPAPYAGQSNPLDATDTGVIVAGGLRFKKNCGCHVANSQNHDPQAPDLGRGEASKRADDWMMWRISEGVAPKMGPFKDTFNETERWQIISYLRALAVKNSNGG